jgi:hypothetical protein
MLLRNVAEHLRDYTLLLPQPWEPNPVQFYIPKVCVMDGRFLSVKRSSVKNAVFWDVTPRCTCKSRRLEGMYRLHPQSDKTR